MKSYAQNGEDLILQALLPKKRGFYVDVGANMPDTDSVTKLFYEKGWRGINIEPVPELYKQLTERRERDININVGVSDSAGKLTLREYQDGFHGWSTFAQNVRDLDDHKVKSFKDYTVPVQTLRSILKQHDVTHIDFLKIDVEGFEYQVLKSNDWKRWRPTIIVVENSKGKWPEVLKEQGYHEIFFDSLNRYYCEDPSIKYLLMRRLIEPFNGSEDVAAYEKLNEQVQLLSDQNGQLDANNQALTAQLNELQASLTQIIEQPENHISNKKLIKAALKQIVRRLTQR